METVPHPPPLSSLTVSPTTYLLPFHEHVHFIANIASCAIQVSETIDEAGNAKPLNDNMDDIQQVCFLVTTLVHSRLGAAEIILLAFQHLCFTSSPSDLSDYSSSNENSHGTETQYNGTFEGPEKNLEVRFSFFICSRCSSSIES